MLYAPVWLGSRWNNMLLITSEKKRREEQVFGADSEACGPLWCVGGHWTERRVISTRLHPAEPLQQVFFFFFFLQWITSHQYAWTKRRDEKQITRRFPSSGKWDKIMFASNYLNRDIILDPSRLLSNLQTWKGHSFWVCKAAAAGKGSDWSSSRYFSYIIYQRQSSFLKLEQGD